MAKETMQEFVEIDETGNERDWINPVISMQETEAGFVIDNGCHTYEVIKQKGWKYITRIKEYGDG